MSLVRTCLAVLTLAASLAVPALAAEMSCPNAPLLLRHVTIIDASGQWDDQDILIEDGRISALGSGLEIDSSERIIELDGQGAIVSPRRDETVRLIVRTSTATPRHDAAIMLMPGVAADLVIRASLAGNGPFGAGEIEMRNGRLAGAETCLAG